MLRRGRCCRWLVLAGLGALLGSVPAPSADATPPTAAVLGGFEARLSWEDPAPGVAVILTLIIYPSNVGSSEGVFTCGQAAAAATHSQVYTQSWDDRYAPTDVELYVHAFQRCTGDWAEAETFPFRLELYQLPGYAGSAPADTPLLLVEGAAPRGDSMSGLRPSGTPVAAIVHVTPASPLPPTPPPGPGSGPGAGSTTGPGTAEAPGDSPGAASTVPGGAADAGDGAPDAALPGWPGPGAGTGWSRSEVAMLIVFLVLILLALGMSLKAAVGTILTTRLGGVKASPTAGETAALAREVHLAMGDGYPTVTVRSPVQPRLGPDAGAARADFMLQPGQPYDLLDGEEAGPETWVQVRQGSRVGWVHRSSLDPWQQEVIVRPRPPGGTGAYREWVTFPGEFDARDPGTGNFTRRPPGSYGVGPPEADGYRPVFDSSGKLIGSIPADRVPSALTPRGGLPPAPPPPPPPPR